MCKAHRILFHSTLGLRAIKKKQRAPLSRLNLEAAGFRHEDQGFNRQTQKLNATPQTENNSSTHVKFGFGLGLEFGCGLGVGCGFGFGVELGLGSGLGLSFGMCFGLVLTPWQARFGSNGTPP